MSDYRTCPLIKHHYRIRVAEGSAIQMDRGRARFLVCPKRDIQRRLIRAICSTRWSFAESHFAAATIAQKLPSQIEAVKSYDHEANADPSRYRCHHYIDWSRGNQHIRSS